MSALLKSGKNYCDDPYTPCNVCRRAICVSLIDIRTSLIKTQQGKDDPL